MKIEIVVVFVIAVYSAKFTNATTVADCKTGDEYEDPNTVQITNCGSPPCVLKRGTKVGVELRILPKRKINNLTTKVTALILGLDLPFIGVNGVSACGRMYKTDGSKADCPLQEGVEYLYKNEFPVLGVYPRINTVVHWALAEGSEDVACFEVPAKIVS